jgi:hypothetical protein
MEYVTESIEKISCCSNPTKEQKEQAAAAIISAFPGLKAAGGITGYVGFLHQCNTVSECVAENFCYISCRTSVAVTTRFILVFSLPAVI